MRKHVYAVATVALFVVVAVAALLYVQHPIRGAADLWNRPWDKVRTMSEDICNRYAAAGTHYFERCMAVERQSYQLLQGSFGLPPDEAEEIKQACAGFQYFTPQVKCVEEELARRDG